MAHKKAAGSATNLRDSKPKYRGVKLFGGQTVEAGNIILRQKGSKYLCGKNTYMGKDFSVHAKIDGIVVFSKKKVEKFNGRKYIKTIVDVTNEVQEVAKKPVVKKASAKSTASAAVKPKKPAAKKAPAKKPAATTAKKAGSTSSKKAATK